MKLTTLALLQIVAVYGATPSIPTCAEPCFYKGIEKSGCGLTDYLCQCTTGAKIIGEVAIPCLCSSTCSKKELLETQEDSASICSSVLSAAGKTYTAPTYPSTVCNAATTSPTGSSSTSSSTSSSSSSTGSPASNPAPAPTHLGVQEVMLGMAGVAMAIL